MEIKRLLYRVLGKSTAKYLNTSYTYANKWRLLLTNLSSDARLYHRHSAMVKRDTFGKVESSIILNYHAIEKGFLHDNFKFRFGVSRIGSLISLLNENRFDNRFIASSQVNAAYLCLCKYYEVHQQNNIDISDFFKEADYLKFKSLLKLSADIVVDNKREVFYDDIQSNFEVFAKSRKSIRNFTGEKVSRDLLYKVIEIAKTAPSVCNRQSAKVYCVENKEKLDHIFKIQGGLGGFTKDITQVLVLTSDRSSFYSVGERNQLYVDGGIFLMNLLYALHYYKVGACPAHWAKEVEDDKKIRDIMGLPVSEKVICIVPIGIPRASFKTTLSHRRSNEEILSFII